MSLNKGACLKSSFDLLFALKRLDYLKTQRDRLWWPHSGTFEVVVGALLTQQSRWEKVEESLANLKANGFLSLERLASASIEEVVPHIKPSGFYNTKAQRLILLAKNIQNDFGSFEIFAKEVDREWLLSQKGFGMESADSILCYACCRPVFVVDSYTQRLLGALGHTFENYMLLQEWVQSGIEENLSRMEELYGEKTDLATIYARFHGKIVEYAKRHIRGKTVDVVPILDNFSKDIR